LSDSAAAKLPGRLPRLVVAHSMGAAIALAGAEVELAPLEGRERRLGRLISDISADYDYILVDCPPSLGILMTNALAAADEILTPIQCEYFALEGLVKIVRVVEQVRDSGANDHLEIGGIVMTMFDARTKLSGQVVAEVRAFDGRAFSGVPALRYDVFRRDDRFQLLAQLGRKPHAPIGDPLREEAGPAVEQHQERQQHDNDEVENEQAGGEVDPRCEHVFSLRFRGEAKHVVADDLLRRLRAEAADSIVMIRKRKYCRSPSV